ncbi:MAG: DNA-binding MarR family transcriptional regulator [Arenicella sp.]|jgi:DNA-binding MarR family transcriptional regulator
MTSPNNLDKFKPASAKFEFREYPFYWVMRLGSRYTQAMEIQLKKKGMNITSWRIGMILRENGTISMTDVAKHAVGRLPTITKSVYRMQGQGLVKVKQSEKDGRVTMVSITPLGLDTIDEMIVSTSRIIDRAFEGLKKTETSQLNVLLQKVFNNISNE